MSIRKKREVYIMLEQIQENYNDNYISVDEAAQYLGIKPVTLRNWIKKTDIPTRKIGKQWKFKRSELDEWVNSGRANFE